VWAGPASAGGDGRDGSGRFGRKGANKPYPAAIVRAAQNKAFEQEQEQLPSLRALAFAAVAAEGQTGPLVDGGAEGDESPGTHMTLYEHPRRGPEPSPLARAWWATFVGSGCLDRVTAQVWEFLRARKSPVALFPKFPHRVFFHWYAAESGDATGCAAASTTRGDGMTDHYDIVPHCAVTVCLTGDGAAPGLYWCRQGARHQLHLDAGDIAIIARGVLHGVERVARKEARLVLVLFY
jgi:hypothetical protein